MKYNSRKNIRLTSVGCYSSCCFAIRKTNVCEVPLNGALVDVDVSPEDIAYVTLEGVLFIARKNDLAFTVKNRVLVISEHQSTINENMPLRDLLYLGRTLEKLLSRKSLYRRKRIPIPTPEFYVFYNGDVPYPTEKLLRLSDAYLEKREHPMLELEIKVININLSSGHRILKECRPMYEYSWFIQHIKDYLADGWSRDDAITQAVQDCLDNGIMAEFMQEYGSEAVNMLYTQWNWDDAMEVEREEAYEDGKSFGDLERSRQSVLDLLEDLGDIPEDIQARIHTEEDTQILRQWLKAAAKAESFDVFREKIDSF